jgi:hypothetical protein
MNKFYIFIFHFERLMCGLGSADFLTRSTLENEITYNKLLLGRKN